MRLCGSIAAFTLGGIPGKLPGEFVGLHSKRPGSVSVRGVWGVLVFEFVRGFTSSVLSSWRTRDWWESALGMVIIE